MNIWAGLIIALATAGIIGYQVKKKSDGANNLSIDLNGRIHSIDFSKVIFAIDAIIKNPSDFEVYILQPYVTISYKGSEIATSNVSDQIIKIAPFEPAPLKTIMISATYINLSSLAGELMKKIQDKNVKVTLDVKILVNMVMGLSGKIPTRLKDYKGSKTIIQYPMKKQISF